MNRETTHVCRRQLFESTGSRLRSRQVGSTLDFVRVYKGLRGFSGNVFYFVRRAWSCLIVALFGWISFYRDFLPVLYFNLSLRRRRFD